MLFDKLKDVAEGVQGAVKSGNVADTAKKVLENVPDQAPERLVQALKELLGHAREKLAGGENKALQECVDKAGKLLEQKEISTAAVTKITAELSELLKGAGQGSAKAAVAPKAQAPKAQAPQAQRSAPAPAAAPKAEAKAARNFTDVEAGAYYYEAVQWAVEKGIASGTSETTFSPDATCSRGQMITFLWRAAGSPAPRSKACPFADVKEGAFYHDAAVWAAEHGVASGKNFEPDAPCTRAQVATFLYRNAGSPKVSGECAFTDVAADAYFHDAVVWVAQKKITAGTSETTFSPDTPCSRGQIVTFLYRAK